MWKDKNLNCYAYSLKGNKFETTKEMQNSNFGTTQNLGHHWVLSYSNTLVPHNIDL